MEDRNEAAKPPTGMEPGSLFVVRRRLERLVERVRDEGLVPRVVLGTAALGGPAWEQEVRAALAALVAGAAIAGFDRAVVRRVQKPGFRPEGVQVVLELPLPLGGVCDDVLGCVEAAEDGQTIDLATLRAWAHGIGAMHEPTLAREAAAGGLTFHEANDRRLLEGEGSGEPAGMLSGTGRTRGPDRTGPRDLPELVHVALLLVLEEKPGGPKVPDEKELAGMREEDLAEVRDWALAVHLRASDNDDVAVPPMPKALRNVLEVLGWQDLPKVLLEGKPALDPDAEAARQEREEAERLDAEEREREEQEAADEAAAEDREEPEPAAGGQSLSLDVGEGLGARDEGQAALPRADAPEAPEAPSQP